MLEKIVVLDDVNFLDVFVVRGDPSTVHDGEVWVGESVKTHEACDFDGRHYPERESILSSAYFDSEAEALAYDGVLRKRTLFLEDVEIPWRVSKVRDAQPPSTIPITDGWCIRVGSKTQEVFVPIRSQEGAKRAYERACEAAAGLPEGSIYFTRDDHGQSRLNAPGIPAGFDGAVVERIGSLDLDPLCAASV